MGSTFLDCPRRLSLQSAYTVIADFHLGVQTFKLRLKFAGCGRLVWFLKEFAY